MARMKTSPDVLALVLASLAALAPFVASNRAAFTIALGGLPPMILVKTLAVSAAVLTDMPPAGTPE